MNPVSIGLLGLGTVGRGTAAILVRNAREIERRAGRPIVVRRALVRDRTKARHALDALFPEGGPDAPPAIELAGDAAALVDDPAIDIVCEAMGGEEPALSLIRRAIVNGKHVITANKALIATHGNELFALAAEHGVVVAFESAVAGGIPVIKAIREGLAANRIEWLAGIINGTGNFILSEMAHEGREFAEVLAEAQALGYAEADPTFDVEGIDAAHKLAILAAIAFGIPLRFDAVFTEGIGAIERADVAFAAELGYRIKHLGIARHRPDGVELRVHPTLVPERRLIANVDGVMNAVLVHGDAVGPTLYYGAGAGGEPTGSAVVADIVDVVRTLDTAPEERVPPLAFRTGALSAQAVLGPDDFECAYYLRLRAADRPGVLADITGIFGELDISIEAIVQKEPEEEAVGADGGEAGAASAAGAAAPGATVASLVSLMGVLGDPLDHGPGPEGSVGWLEWMPYEHPDGGTLVSSRYLLLRGAYVARAADLGATDPTRASDQDEVIAEALGQEVEAVARGRIRQVGPERLERSNSDPRPISTELLCAHLGLDDPPPIRHLWTGTLLLVDRLQRRLLAQGTSAADIERAFGRYACQRVLHSFDLEPNWPHRLVSQIQSVSVATRRLTVRLAVRRRWEGARDPKSSPESR